MLFGHNQHLRRHAGHKMDVRPKIRKSLALHLDLGEILGHASLPIVQAIDRDGVNDAINPRQAATAIQAVAYPLSFRQQPYIHTFTGCQTCLLIH